MLMDNETKTIVVAAMVAKSEEHEKSREYAYFPNIMCIKIVYDRTTEGSPARGFLVDLYTKEYVKGSISDTEVDKMPKDFLYDLTISLSAKRPLLQDYDNLSAAHVKELENVQDLKTHVKERTKKLKEKNQTIKSLEEAMRKLNATAKKVTDNKLKAAKAQIEKLKGGMERMRKYIPKGLHSQFYGT